MPCDTPEREALVCSGRKCDPTEGPDWRIEIPEGVNARTTNSGYALNLKNLQPGRYFVSAQVPANLMDREEPAKSIVQCNWAPGGSVKTQMEFWVQ